MEAKGVFPEGREASSDHCLLTERVHTDRRRHTFSVSHRYRFHQELDHWRVAHRHDSHHGLCDYATNSSAQNNRASEDEAVDDAREMFATACRSLVVHSDQHKSPSEDEANSDEQGGTIIRSVPSVLLQGAAKRRSQTMIAAVSTRRTSAQSAERGVVRSATRVHSIAMSQQCRRSPCTCSNLAVCQRC